MWQKIKDGFRSFMSGRHGSDQLCLALLIAGIALSLISSISGVGILYYIGLAAYVWAIFRMLSRNEFKRAEENRKFLDFSRSFKENVRQFFARAKNMKQYRYFKCPQCKARLRLPRKVGEVTVTCGKCHHQFKEKA